VNFLNASPTAPQDVYNLKSEWSRSVTDIPHRFTMAASYDLPVGKGRLLPVNNRFLNLFVGNWSFNTITTFQSGSPLAISQNTNNNSRIGTSIQRPNLTGADPCKSGSPVDRLNNYIDPAGFSTAPAFTFGSAPRTLGCLSPGLANWDISLFKSFPVGERVSLQFRAEALNAFNTPQFRAPNMAFGNSNFGKITQQANYPRYLQLGGRISF